MSIVYNIIAKRGVLSSIIQALSIVNNGHFLIHSASYATKSISTTFKYS